jgi:hypothetical protein
MLQTSQLIKSFTITGLAHLQSLDAPILLGLPAPSSFAGAHPPTPLERRVSMPDSITPSLELVTSLRNSAPHGIRDAGVTRELWLINSAYAAGADQELEACVEQVDEAGYPSLAAHIRASRRPQPPSLKKQALAALNGLSTQPASRFLQLDPDSELAIRLALEALPND